MKKMKNGERLQIQKEIQEKFDLYEIPEFDKKVRGYDPEEVDRYLNDLVDAYTKMYNECEALRKEVDEYRLYKEKIANILIESDASIVSVQEDAKESFAYAQPAEFSFSEELKDVTEDFNMKELSGAHESIGCDFCQEEHNYTYMQQANEPALEKPETTMTLEPEDTKEYYAYAQSEENSSPKKSKDITEEFNLQESSGFHESMGHDFYQLVEEILDKKRRLAYG